MADHPFDGPILESFLSCDGTKDEQAFFGPVNMLLYTQFTPQQKFIVAPVTTPLSDREGFKFSLDFRVRHPAGTALMVQVHPEWGRASPSMRYDAFRQARRALGDAMEDSPGDTIHLLSIFGPHFGVFILDKRTRHLLPAAIAKDPARIVDLAPSVWWKHDLTTLSGADTLVTLFQEIRMDFSAYSMDESRTDENSTDDSSITYE